MKVAKLNRRTHPQFPEDLVTFTGEILNGKLYFFCVVFIRIQIPFVFYKIKEVFMTLSNIYDGAFFII